jgi:hypothetical protein
MAEEPVEEPVGPVGKPVPLAAFELTRLFIAEPPAGPFVPVLLLPNVEGEPRAVPTELPEEAEPEPPTACANTKVGLRASTDASATVAGFMLSPWVPDAAQHRE